MMRRLVLMSVMAATVGGGLAGCLGWGPASPRVLIGESGRLQRATPEALRIEAERRVAKRLRLDATSAGVQRVTIIEAPRWLSDREDGTDYDHGVWAWAVCHVVLELPARTDAPDTASLAAEDSHLRAVVARELRDRCDRPEALQVGITRGDAPSAGTPGHAPAAPPAAPTDAPPTAEVTAPTPATPDADSTTRTHTVAAGETFGDISARYYGSPRFWRLLVSANPAVQENQGKLVVGMVLTIPPLPADLRPAPASPPAPAESAPTTPATVPAPVAP